MLKNVFKPVLLFALVFTMNSCATSEDENLADAVLVTEYAYNDFETDMAQRINAHRESQGLNSLQLINHVSYKSMEHNEYMISHRVVNHDYFQDRASNIMEVIGAVKVNENIAYNYSAPAGALNAWLNSPGHKANIEGDFTHFGISISTDPETGKKYYTNMFLKK